MIIIFDLFDTIPPLHPLGRNGLIGVIANLGLSRLSIRPPTEKLYAVLPAGSTAYNFSVGGRILNLESPRLAITPISPFRPRGWRGGIVSNKSKIIIKNLDKKKRPVSAVSDNTEIRNAHIIKISINTKIQFRLLYNKKSGLVERNIAEQFKF